MPDLNELFPPGAATASLNSSESVADLLPEEEAFVESAVERRRRDFAAGRHCARLALAKLGQPTAPILRGSDREPLWPHGICGSITHCEGYAAAVAGRGSVFAALGMDAEPRMRPITDSVLERITLPEEREALPGSKKLPWPLLLFSAKESIFKAWFPLVRGSLGFRQANVRFDPEACTFRARILVNSGPSVIEGRYVYSDELVVTGTWVLA